MLVLLETQWNEREWLDRRLVWKQGQLIGIMRIHSNRNIRRIRCRRCILGYSAKQVCIIWKNASTRVKWLTVCASAQMVNNIHIYVKCHERINRKKKRRKNHRNPPRRITRVRTEGITKRRNCHRANANADSSAKPRAKLR